MPNALQPTPSLFLTAPLPPELRLSLLCLSQRKLMRHAKYSNRPEIEAKQTYSTRKRQSVSEVCIIWRQKRQSIKENLI